VSPKWIQQYSKKTLHERLRRLDRACAGMHLFQEFGLTHRPEFIEYVQYDCFRRLIREALKAKAKEEKTRGD